MMSVQAIRLKKRNFTLVEARNKVNSMGYSSTYMGKSPFTQTENEWRFRQVAPSKFDSDSFRTKRLKGGINLILGKLKKSK